MSMWQRFLNNVNDAIFEDSTEDNGSVEKASENGTSTGEPDVSPEQLAKCEVAGDMRQTALNMFSEAVKDLDAAGTDNTIQKIQECMDTWGEDCNSSIVLKMLKIAKIQPDVLKKDGELRIEKINGVISMISSNTERVLAQTSQTSAQIDQALREEQSACDSDIKELEANCEKQIEALREQLKKDISAREDLCQQRLDEFSSRQAETSKRENDAKLLKEAVDKLGAESIESINKLLEMLKPQQDNNGGEEQ